MTTASAPKHADVIFDDQLSNGTRLVVARVALRESGFVAIVNETADASSNASILGSSVFLKPGTHTGVAVELNAPIEGNRTLTAVVFTDTSGDRNPDEDGSDEVVEGPNGSAVTDTANVTVMATATTIQEPTVTTTRGSNITAKGKEQHRPDDGANSTSPARRTEATVSHYTAKATSETNARTNTAAGNHTGSNSGNKPCPAPTENSSLPIEADGSVSV